MVVTEMVHDSVEARDMHVANGMEGGSSTRMLGSTSCWRRSSGHDGRHRAGEHRPLRLGGHRWSAVLEQLDAGRAEHYWLATVGPDGRPHLAGVGARWVDGRLYFKSGARTRKSKNLDGDRRCVIAAELPGLDVTFSGEAEMVTDASTVQRVADFYAASGWPARPAASNSRPTTAHPPPARRRGTSGPWRRSRRSGSAPPAHALALRLTEASGHPL